MSEPKNVNVTISNVISWFEESEQCMLHNHAEIIPTTKSVMLDLIDKIKHASMTNSDYDAIVLKESIETLREVVQNSYDKPLSNPFDEIHDYVNVISQKTLMAEAQRSLAEADGSSDYYYWEGYVEALDYAIDSLPNYNN
jgi:hypothetical protein